MKKIITLIMIGITICFTSCSSCKHIEDTNGDDDYSLCQITNENIINGMNSISMSSVKTSKNNSHTLRINKFSGVNSIYKETIKNTIVTINAKVTLNSGNLRVVVVGNKEILFDFVINGSSTYTLPSNVSSYQIKIAGETAKFKIEYTISYK